MKGMTNFGVGREFVTRGGFCLSEACLQPLPPWWWFQVITWRFRKCWTYWAGEVLTGSYRPSKMDESEKTGPSPKIRGVKKKRHGHNFEFWGLKRIARPANHVWRPCYSFQTPKIDIVAVSFFFDTASSENFFFKFHPTLTANNSGLKPSKLKNYHIFGMPRTSAFSWYTPFRSYYWITFRKMHFCLSKR